MNTIKKPQAKIILIGIALGLCYAVIIGIVAGTFNLSAGVFVPIIVIPITIGGFLFARNRWPK